MFDSFVAHIDSEIALSFRYRTIDPHFDQISPPLYVKYHGFWMGLFFTILGYATIVELGKNDAYFVNKSSLSAALYKVDRAAKEILSEGKHPHDTSQSLLMYNLFIKAADSTEVGPYSLPDTSRLFNMFSGIASSLEEEQKSTFESKKAEITTNYKKLKKSVPELFWDVFSEEYLSKFESNLTSANSIGELNTLSNQFTAAEKEYNARALHITLEPNWFTAIDNVYKKLETAYPSQKETIANRKKNIGNDIWCKKIQGESIVDRLEKDIVEEAKKFCRKKIQQAPSQGTTLFALLWVALLKFFLNTYSCNGSIDQVDSYQIAVLDKAREIADFISKKISFEELMLFIEQIPESDSLLEVKNYYAKGMLKMTPSLNPDAVVDPWQHYIKSTLPNILSKIDIIYTNLREAFPRQSESISEKEQQTVTFVSQIEHERQFRDLLDKLHQDIEETATTSSKMEESTKSEEYKALLNATWTIFLSSHSCATFDALKSYPKELKEIVDEIAILTTIEKHPEKWSNSLKNVSCDKCLKEVQETYATKKLQELYAKGNLPNTLFSQRDKWWYKGSHWVIYKNNGPLFEAWPKIVQVYNRLKGAFPEQVTSIEKIQGEMDFNISDGVYEEWDDGDIAKKLRQAIDTEADQFVLKELELDKIDVKDEYTKFLWNIWNTFCSERSNSVNSIGQIESYQTDIIALAKEIERLAQAEASCEEWMTLLAKLKDKAGAESYQEAYAKKRLTQLLKGSSFAYLLDHFKHSWNLFVFWNKISFCLTYYDNLIKFFEEKKQETSWVKNQKEQFLSNCLNVEKLDDVITEELLTILFYIFEAKELASSAIQFLRSVKIWDKQKSNGPELRSQAKLLYAQKKLRFAVHPDLFLQKKETYPELQEYHRSLLEAFFKEVTGHATDVQVQLEN